MKVKISYTQLFRGELIDDSFIRFVDNKKEIDKIIKNLYQDEHVTCVWWEEIEEKGD